MSSSRSAITHVVAKDSCQQRIGLSWRSLLTTILVIALSSPAAATKRGAHGAPHWQNKHYVENGFYDIALNGEYEQLQPVVRKWVQPLRIWFYSEAGDRAQQQWLLSTHFQQLSGITGLPVEFVPHREQANVRILFISDRDRNGMAARELSRTGRRELKRSICLGQIRFNRRAEITQGTVVIPVERATSRRKLVACVIEEVTQMLGLINDSRHFHPTVFSDVTDDEFLTGLDFLLLKLLYSPELLSGMTRAQASPVIRRQLDIWERNGLIHRASPWSRTARATRL
jgi:hypothetical protein